eukprot:6468396-Amphidinium_carterae.1
MRATAHKREISSFDCTNTSHYMEIPNVNDITSCRNVDKELLVKYVMMLDTFTSASVHHAILSCEYPLAAFVAVWPKTNAAAFVTYAVLQSNSFLHPGKTAKLRCMKV